MPPRPCQNDIESHLERSVGSRGKPLRRRRSQAALPSDIDRFGTIAETPTPTSLHFAEDDEPISATHDVQLATAISDVPAKDHEALPLIPCGDRCLRVAAKLVRVP